ncbi:uncharacterized protein LOC115682737 [Syzygium oleosum]|uniref:uncharacterized protein LOC115682737 n=1 Tax=Syzygium oleosum TaxID=219896 RepID=UPI0024B90B03|nr:uncharacterized protein LOC115682737 [Syzygium oleosum]XP_030462916.2 uncharacterized protein LOC115682737 [Syzygium oleosum]XP_056177549.1 uncharacterized protein LOC115682737 [Syzygium oleosum]XP_056177550.1 uncharacterized protein LOC115682737 [Syzygium oleosum]XP_056177551.1 uncharacterized protein LOC115682737 [Syzygium oleosum]
MMLRCGNMPMVVACRPSSRRPMCFASAHTTDTEQLRAQLDQLHAEAETTRTKANNARLRLLRLSEAAEKLRRQASINVQTGKENDARELLLQKKKIMQALEKSNSRIRLLDELSAKLNEAISIKESQLIGNVAADLEVGSNNMSNPVHIVSPKQDILEVVHEKESSDPGVSENGERTDSDASLSPEGNLAFDNNADHIEEHVSVSRNIENHVVDRLNRISSFDDFLEGLDEQLKKIEEELTTISMVSTLILDVKENRQNMRMQQIIELIESVRDIRERISGMMQKVETT